MALDHPKVSPARSTSMPPRTIASPTRRHNQQVPSSAPAARRDRERSVMAESPIAAFNFPCDFLTFASQTPARAIPKRDLIARPSAGRLSADVTSRAHHQRARPSRMAISPSRQGRPVADVNVPRQTPSPHNRSAPSEPRPS